MKLKMSRKEILIFIIMVLLAVVMIYPFYFMINSSFKSNAQFLGAPGHSLLSWHKLFKALPVGRQLLNSTIVCTASILIILSLYTRTSVTLQNRK